MFALSLFGVCLGAAGCHIDMWRQPKKLAQSESDFFADGLADRKPVPGTVARGELRLDDGYYTGFENGRLIRDFPAKVQISEQLLARGQERFGIFCTHCHGDAGYGDGMIAQRGLNLRRPPASFHTDRLREMPVGHFYDVISEGYGVMYGHKTRIPVEDRWAIVAYIRALQLSQNFPADMLDAQEREKASAPPVTNDANHGGGY